MNGLADRRLVQVAPSSPRSRVVTESKLRLSPNRRSNLRHDGLCDYRPAVRGPGRSSPASESVRGRSPPRPAAARTEVRAGACPPHKPHPRHAAAAITRTYGRQGAGEAGRLLCPSHPPGAAGTVRAGSRRAPGRMRPRIVECRCQLSGFRAALPIVSAAPTSGAVSTSRRPTGPARGSPRSGIGVTAGTGPRRAPRWRTTTLGQRAQPRHHTAWQAPVLRGPRPATCRSPALVSGRPPDSGRPGRA